MGALKAAFLFLRALVIPKFVWAMVNLALRQQVAVFKHSVKRPKLRRVSGRTVHESLFVS